MRIVCAETVLLGHSAFGQVGETTVVPDRHINRDHLLDADALIVRSKTRVTRELLQGTPVRFVGTATAGADHLDTTWFQRNNIGWCNAPGCNANSVSEYVMAALLTLANRHAFSLAGKTLGVIGCGNVGRRVLQKAEGLGLRVLRNDPPLAATSPDPDFVPLETLLAQADIVSLHVPLIDAKPWPTRRLADHRFFERLRPGALFINAARGGVCDYDALLAARRAGIVAHMVIDVWDPEPAFRTDILAAADLATPHIAGHSYEGKLNGTIACYDALCRFFELERTWDIAASVQPPSVPEILIDCTHRSDEAVLHELVRRIYDITTDDTALRAGNEGIEPMRAAHFDALRKHYPIRREFMNTRVRLQHATAPLLTQVAALGFAP